MEELKRLKNLKKQEIMDKIAKIKEVAGVDGVDFTGLDLDEDYDPDSHAAKMASVFNSEFYGEVSRGACVCLHAADLVALSLQDDANEKPVWDDDIDITDIVPAGKDDEAYAPGGEAYDPTEAGHSGKKSRAERKKEKKAKKKDKGKQREVLDEEQLKYEDEGGAEPEAAFDPAEFDDIADPEERKRKVEQVMDEYYKMDYEDVVGDLPTRFHYTSSLNPAGTSADPSGLTAMEILMATDAELNEFESLRKLAPYRGQKKEDGANKKRKKLKELRKRLAQRRWGDELPNPEDETTVRPKYNKKRKVDMVEGAVGEPAGPPKKRMGKKERQKKEANGASVEA